MARPSHLLKLAVLQCERLQEHLAPSVFQRTGGYSQLLEKAFAQVATPASTVLHPQITVSPSISFTEFDVKAFRFPKEVTDFDGVLITGSLSGVYDGDAWIERLLHEIRDLDRKRVKTVGISFGHQAIAQALGGHVGRNPKGSEVSVRSAWVTEAGKRVFLPPLNDFCLHYHHNDAILKLPPGFVNLASNNVTEFMSIYKRQQFLTFCGHPDYSHNIEVLEKLLEYDREKLWVPEQLVEHGLDTLSQPTDYEWVLKQILLFYCGTGPSSLASTKGASLAIKLTTVATEDIQLSSPKNVEGSGTRARETASPHQTLNLVCADRSQQFHLSCN